MRFPCLVGEVGAKRREGDSPLAKYLALCSPSRTLPHKDPKRGEGAHRPRGTISAPKVYSITSATTFLPRNDAVEPIASTNGIASAQIAASSA